MLGLAMRTGRDSNEGVFSPTKPHLEVILSPNSNTNASDHCEDDTNYHDSYISFHDTEPNDEYAG